MFSYYNAHRGGIAALMLGLCPSLATGAPLELSEVPLFLGTSAPPNIMLLVDDSGSMDWNLVTPETSGVMQFRCSAASERAYHRYVLYSYTHQTGDETFADSSANGLRMPTDELVESFSSDNVAGGGVQHGQGFWRAWNSAYNTLYYDPEISYLPWKDSSGASLADANPVAVRVDPVRADVLYDLTSEQTYRTFIPCRVDQYRNVSFYPARYYQWSDSDGNGRADPLDGHVLVELRPEGATACSAGASCPSQFPRGPARRDCAAIAAGSGAHCTRGEELRNFANWFQYYRRRELTAKAAFGNIVADSNARMGLATLHDNNSVKTAIRSLNVDNNRGELLSRLYQIGSSGGTPLLPAVNNCGLYLNCGGTSTSIEPGSVIDSNRNPFGFRHDGGRDDVNGDGVSDTLAPGCPALAADKGGSCQQNFLIAMTDGYYNTSNPRVGNHDGDGNTSWDGGAYADSVPDTLADITMRFYERDIQPNLANNVPAIPGVDGANHQHMVSYMVAFGLDGTIGPHTPGTGPDGMPANPATPFNWPDPGADENGVFPDLNDANPEKLDDVRHAAYNGRGKFLSAKRPQELISALLDAVASIADRSSSASSVALNAGSLNTGTRIFQARFDSSDWSGELLAYAISSGVPNQDNGCTAETLGSLCPELWSAAAVLDGQNWDTQRRIITRDSDSGDAIPFRWNSLGETQKAWLCDDPATGAHETCSDTELGARGRARLEYLRGARGDEHPRGLRFRARGTVLGDIVNSDPFYVGPPAAAYEALPGIGDDYTSFRRTHGNRLPMVVAGANDGMLHVFNARDGSEMLAYVPSTPQVFADLGRLTSPQYAHRFFVDGSPAAGDAWFDHDGDGREAWRTVVVGGLRAGGQAIYALDITNPAQFSEANADQLLLWEFTDADDADLGYVYGRPSIVRMRNGKWAVLVGNGYNNSDALDGNDTQVSATGRAYLFILFLDGPGSDGRWDEGTDYIKLEVPAGSVTTPNGLASPTAADIDTDFTADYVYAGDLEGNLWRFDVNSTLPAAWSLGRAGNPLFRACSADPCTDATRQPITVKPEVGPHPDGPPTPQSNKGVLVYFGTGRYLASTDRTPANGQNQAGTANQTQSFYAVWDPLDSSNTTHTRAALTRQAITQEINRDGGACTVERPDCFRALSNNPVRISTAEGATRGWYLDLVNSNSTQNPAGSNKGERQVSDPILRGGRLLFTTLQPNPNQCEFGGTGWLMELSPFSGAQLGFVPFDVNNDGLVDGADSQIFDESGAVIGHLPALGGMRSIVGIVPRPTLLDTPGGSGPDPKQDRKYLSGSLGSIQTVVNRKAEKSGRLTWRQVR